MGPILFFTTHGSQASVRGTLDGVLSYSKFKLPSACGPMAAEAQFVERAMAFSYNEFKLPSAYNKLKLRSAWGPRGSAIPSLSRLSDFSHIS